MKVKETTKKQLEELCKRLNILFQEPKSEDHAQKMIAQIKINWGE